MPSPFPGIDPYVQAQGRWTDFHPRLIYLICDALSDRLPGDYLAQIGERLDLMSWSSDRPRSAYPDVIISRGGPSRREGAVAVATALADWEPMAASMVETEGEIEVRYTWAEILHLPEQRLVTSIEVLSPTNKAGMGHREYLDKFRRLWNSDVNLVEIDLLLGGLHLPLAWPHPRGDFFVTIARAGQRPNCEVSGWSIRQGPPTIPIPLRAPDPDIPLNLSQLITTAYARGRYERVLDYTKPLSLPLADEDHEWAGQVVRGANGGSGEAEGRGPLDA